MTATLCPGQSDPTAHCGTDNTYGKGFKASEMAYVGNNNKFGDSFEVARYAKLDNDIEAGSRVKVGEFACVPRGAKLPDKTEVLPFGAVIYDGHQKKRVVQTALRFYYFKLDKITGNCYKVDRNQFLEYVQCDIRKLDNLLILICLINLIRCVEGVCHPKNGDEFENCGERIGNNEDKDAECSKTAKIVGLNVIRYSKLTIKAGAVLMGDCHFMGKSDELGDVTIEPYAFVERHSTFYGKMTIGQKSLIKHGSTIRDSTIENDVTVKEACTIVMSKIHDGAIIEIGSSMYETTIEKGAKIGPYSMFGPKTVVKTNINVGRNCCVSRGHTVSKHLKSNTMINEKGQREVLTGGKIPRLVKGICVV